MVRERDYGSEYDKDKRRYPEFVGGSTKLEKPLPVWMDFSKMTPVDESDYQPGMVTRNAKRRLADNPYYFTPEQLLAEEEPQQSNPKQSNPTKEQHKPEPSTAPPEKKGFFQRLFGGNQNQNQQKQPEATKKKQNPYAAPRAQNLSQSRRDRPAVADFKQRARAKAKGKLEQNKEQVYQLDEAYTSGAKSKPLLDELRPIVKQDGQLEAQQKQIERELALHSNDPGLAGESPAMGGSIRVNPERQAELTYQLEQIKQVRATLLAQYPAAGLIKPHEVEDSVSDAQLQEILSSRFAGVNRDIDAAKAGIDSGDIPLSELDAILPEVLAETPEQDRAEVEKYLKKQQRIDTAIEVGGTLGELGLTAGAIVTGILSGGIIPTILGGLGTALGIGTAVYEFERAGDLNLVAKTGDAGGNQLLTEPNRAKKDYLLGWTNLVLAGIDGGLAIKEGASLLKGAKAAEQILSQGGSEIVAQLKPEQIRKFNALVSSPDDVQSQKLYQSLQKELGQDFDTAYSVFVRANQQVGGKTEFLRGDLWDSELAEMARLDPEFNEFPELESMHDLAKRNPSQKEELLQVEAEKIRLNLLRNNQDLGNIYDVMRKSGMKVSREDIALVKQYNFNSPGIYFSPDNYKSWMKLARGKGTVNDARYLLHEIEEVKQLKKIQQETGFDFMGRDYFKMDKNEKRAWQNQFYNQKNQTGYYLQAHSKAVEHEYKFMSRQIAEITEGNVDLKGRDDYLKLILSEPNANLRDDHVKNMQVYGRTLKNYLDEGTPKYVELQETAQQPIKLPQHVKQKLRLYDPVTLGDLITRAKQQKLKK